MAITYSAPNGTQITSPAMTETLGSQTQQTGSNTVVVSDTLGNIGGGQIGNGTNGVGDTYAGRLIIIDQNGTDEQVRYVTNDAAGTGTTRILTVSEAWITTPAQTTHAIHVCYELADIEDGGAGNGIGLSSKTGLWELSNQLTINSTGNLFVGNGQGMECDDQGSTVAFIIQSGGWFYMGYALAGASVAGGIITSFNNTVGEPNVQVQSGGHARVFDAVIWSQLQPLQFECANGSDAEFTDVNFLSSTDELHLYDAMVKNCSASGREATTQIVRVDAGTIKEGSMVLSNLQVLDSAADTAAETIELEGVQFVNVPGYVDVRQNKTWNLIDPVWDVTTYTDLTWTGTSTGNELNDRRSITAVVQESDGTKLQDALINVYENTILADLVLEATSAATTGLASGSFIYKKHATNSATTTYGGHALQCGKWLYKPLVFAQVSTDNFSGTITLSPDSNIVQTTQATAKSAGSTVTWNEDTNPSDLFGFDTGSGTQAVGMILTFSGGAVGTLTESKDGDSVSGVLHLKDRNATAIGATDTFSRTGGTAGTFSGTCNAAVSPIQPFSIWIDAQTLSYQTIYDYLAAIQTETTLTADGELIWEWCRSAQTQPLYATGSGFFTERSNGKGIIIVDGGSGTIDYVTDDAGVTWTAPATITLQVTVLDATDDTPITTANVQLLKNSDKSVLLSGAVNGSGVISVPITYDTDTDVVGWAREHNVAGTDYIQQDFSGQYTANGFAIVIRLQQAE